MQKVRARIASTNLDLSNEVMSPEVLESIAHEAVGIPVTINFNFQEQVGCVTKAWVEDGFVVVEAELSAAAIKLSRELPGYIVPGMLALKSEQVGGIKLLTNVRLTCVGICSAPTDTSLTRIELIKEDNK